MKKIKIILFAILLLVPAFTFAKTQVKADKIIDQINKGQTVLYKDAEIIGDLDFSSVNDVTLDKKGKLGSTAVYSYHIRTPLSFINCVFRGDVIGYVHYDKKNETHNAIFYKDVDFQGCEFEGKSAFKYVKFLKGANFKETNYHKEALFKYSKFSKDVSFANAHFSDKANFKYTDFPGSVYFNNAVFQRYADFKYTEFPEGVSFENAEFMKDANFKYAELYEPLNFDGVVFNDDVDFKYTKVESKSFTQYLLKKKLKK